MPCRRHPHFPSTTQPSVTPPCTSVFLPQERIPGDKVTFTQLQGREEPRGAALGPCPGSSCWFWKEAKAGWGPPALREVIVAVRRLAGLAWEWRKLDIEREQERERVRKEKEREREVGESKAVGMHNHFAGTTLWRLHPKSLARSSLCKASSEVRLNPSRVPFPSRAWGVPPHLTPPPGVCMFLAGW